MARLTWDRKAIRNRLLSYRLVDKTTGCWLSTLAPGSSGYVSVRVDGVHQEIHRLAMYAFRGVLLPPGRSVFSCHKCDVKVCFRPAHLFPGTAKTNASDSIRKGRRPYTVDTCSKGHSFKQTGKCKYCPECGRIRARDRYRALNMVPSSKWRGDYRRRAA